MSGAGVPYRLRPHKTVDRRLFFELLNRVERWVDLRDYVYASMAAYSMEDQKLIHRALGIKRLLAFDMDEEVVKRQEFNKPIDTCLCRELTAGELTADIEKVMSDLGLDDAMGYLVWLDYTDPKMIKQQLGEFEALVSSYRLDDIVRVTVNADYDRIAGPKKQSGKSVSVIVRQELAARKLRGLISEYIGPNFSANDLSDHGFAVVLAESFGIAADRAMKNTPDRVLEPLSIVRYADGQQMLSMTAMVVRREHREDLRKKIGLDEWAFASKSWSDVKYLAVPDLTVRERLFLERNVIMGKAAIDAALGFDVNAATEMPEFFSNFSEYYRHYPTFTTVEI